MGILNSNIGYQLGLLAGGLWAERYRQRGQEKQDEKDLQARLDKNPFYQNLITDANNTDNTVWRAAKQAALGINQPAYTPLYQNTATNPLLTLRSQNNR